MPHDLPLVATLAVGLGFAFLAGLGARRLGLPSLVGYLLVGVAIGPHTPGFVGDSALAQQLAEIGVILLMFGVGTHFSMRDLREVRDVALPGALGQIVVVTALGLGAATLWGWSLGAGLVFGLSLSVASTVVALRALGDRGLLNTHDGRIAVGWLVVEDLAMVLALVLLPAVASALGGTAGAAVGLDQGLLVSLAITAAKLVAFVLLMRVVGMRLLPLLFDALTRTDSRELVTLFVTAVALGIAYGASALFGVSFALGAFVAGMVVNEADLSHRIGTQAEALEHVFGVLFFVSVGMLFDPMILVVEPWRVLAVVAIITVGNSLAAFSIMLLKGYPLASALTVSASLAQIGEFSFILAALGVALGLLSAEARDLILAGALFSITLNPVLFAVPALLRKHLAGRWSALAGALERRPVPRDAPPVAVPGDHVIIVGYGRVGRAIGKALRLAEVPFLVMDPNREIVARLRKRGTPVVAGDATSPGMLEAAGIADARLVILALPDAWQARHVLRLVRERNPTVEVTVRTHNDDQLEWFREQGVGLALMAERELADALTRHALGLYGKA